MEAKNDTKKPAFLMDVEQIKKALPHRYPFLFVDRVLEMSDTRIVAIKNVTANEAFFQGHFPQKPVMPGVLIVEALAQTGGIMMLTRGENQGKLAYLIGVDQAKFRRMVVPGDTLRFEVEVVKMKSKIGVVKGTAWVGDEEACSAEIMFALGE